MVRHAPTLQTQVDLIAGPRRTRCRRPTSGRGRVSNRYILYPEREFTADAETIARVLVGVGQTKAEAIVAYREENGRFEDLEDLTRVHRKEKRNALSRHRRSDGQAQRVPYLAG